MMQEILKIKAGALAMRAMTLSVRDFTGERRESAFATSWTSDSSQIRHELRPGKRH